MASRGTRIHGSRLAIFASMLLGACAAEPVGPTDTPSGPWAWVESTGGISEIHWTPDSAGRHLTFYFHREGVLTVYSDTGIAARTGFRVERGTGESARDTVTLRYTEPLSVFSFVPRLEHQRVIRIDGDTLILADPCCDRYRHTFVRIH